MENEKSGLDSFVSSSIRGRKQAVREQLLCKKLVKSNRCDKLQRIIELSEAAYFAKKMSPKIKLDMNLVDVLHKVSYSLATPQTVLTDIANTRIKGDPESKQTIYSDTAIVKRITWNFQNTEENFEKYIHPWIIEPSYISNCMPFYEQMEKINRRTKELYDTQLDLAKELKELKDTPEDSQKGSSSFHFFFLICAFLTEAGLENLRTNFVSWANPKATAIEEEISQLVSPDTLMEFFKADREVKENE